MFTENSGDKSLLEPELNTKWETAKLFRIPLPSQGPTAAAGNAPAYQTLTACLPPEARSSSVVRGCLHSGAVLSPKPLASHQLTRMANLRTACKLLIQRRGLAPSGPETRDLRPGTQQSLSGVGAALSLMLEG